METRVIVDDKDMKKVFNLLWMLPELLFYMLPLLVAITVCSFLIKIGF